MLDLIATIHFIHKNIQFEIKKTAEIQSHGKEWEVARTYSYSYTVSDHLGCLFRYCSPHPSHNQFHHIHEVIEEILKL